MRVTCPHCQGDLELTAAPTSQQRCPDCGQPLAGNLFGETMDVAAVPADETAKVWAPPVTAPGSSFGSGSSSSTAPARTPGPVPTRFGRYRVTGELAPGELATIFRGHDDELGRDVAIRVPHPEALHSPEAIEWFLRMGQSLAQLDHPSIIPVYDVGRTDDGWCYQVSKLVEGAPISAVLRRERLSHAESIRIVATVARALHHAHRRGMIHRGLKPFNILLDASRNPHLANFGLLETYRAGGGAGGSPEANSLAYLSPEQACDEEHRVDARTDIYSLGAILYELLAGSWPLHGMSRPELKSRLREIEIPALRRVDVLIAPEIERICHKAISFRISDRHSTSLDLAEELEACLATIEQATRTPTPNPSASYTASQTATPPPLTATAATSSPTPTSTPSSDSRSRGLPAAPKVIPKGLRSFDGDDAEFFLDLLPGPRARNGLPESLRFWKDRLEETDPEKTFPVGLIYGPSGCGKSSLVKAGLIPRLAPSVYSVYVEATTGGTESRILDRLHRRCPLLSGKSTLREAFAAMRRGEGLAGEGKIVIFVDQFEQWLHAHGHEEEQGELIRAIRQSDGEHLQVVLMVRDDFWMGITRFFGELEVSLSEGQNSAAVDLFSPQHTRKVLVEFGRAFGSLPEDEEEFSRENRAFLEQAVKELASEGATIPVRVALFADMVKGRRWTASNLRRFGGTEGIGVTFLEETFSTETSPPEYRFHQRAARAILTALLPEKGTDIKGHMRSREDLLVISGYERHPREFKELLRILDGQLRLITPTDPLGISQEQELEEGAGKKKPPETGKAPAGSHYYLTHDYLVPAIREWLVRKGKETARGRAELLLQERTMTWSTRPEKKFLPTFLEWCRILYYTRKRIWTPKARRMMGRATRMHVTRSTLVLLLIGALSWGALEVARSIEIRGLRNQLLYVEPVDAGSILEKIASRIEAMEPLLRAELAEAPEASSARLNLALALLGRDASQIDYLLDRALELPTAEFRLVRDALRPHRETLTNRLWSLLGDASSPPTRRLRAAGLLAAYDPPGKEDPGKWKPLAAELASMLHAMTVIEPACYNELVTELEPARALLLESLAGIARDPGRESAALSIARNLVVDYADSRPDLLVEMLLADPAEVRSRKAIAKLESQRERAVALLSPVLERQVSDLVPEWSEASGAFSPASEELIEAVEGATGFIEDEFALFQTLPLDSFEALTEDLRTAGFRPLQFQPYLAGEIVRVAAVFSRDGREWSVLYDLDEGGIQEALAAVASGERHLEDLASYELPGGEIRYSLSQAARLEADPERLGYVGEGEDTWRDFKASVPDYWAIRFHDRLNLSNRHLLCAVLEKGARTERSRLRTRARYERELAEEHAGRLQVDIDVSRTPIRTTAQARRHHWERLLRSKRTAVENANAPLARWYELGEAALQCEHYEEAIAAFTHYAENGGTSWRLSNSVTFSIVAAVKLGQLDRARKILAQGEAAGAGVPEDRVAWKLFLALYLEEDPDSVMEQAELDLTGKSIFLAALYARGVHAVKTRKPELVRLFTDRALALIQEQRETGDQDLAGWLSTESHFDPIYDDPDFRALQLEATLDAYPEVESARLGEREQARRGKLTLRGRIARRAITEAYLGNDAVLSWFEEQSRPREDEPFIHVNVMGRAYSLASQAHRLTNPARSRELVGRALGHLEAAMSRYNDPLNVLWQIHTESNFLALRDDPRFPSLLDSLSRLYSSTYRTSDSGLESRESHGLDPVAHLSLARELVAEGYRPRAISACLPDEGKPTEIASVWHRPILGDGQKAELAARQATAAAALLRLGQPGRTLAFLRNSEDPRLRAFLMERLESLIGDGGELLSGALEGQEEPTVRQAIILVLGRVLEDGPGATLRERLIPRLLELCREDPDPGVHSAASWALRRWGQEEKLAELERSLPTDSPVDGRDWWLTRSGVSMTLLREPVEFDMGSPESEPGRETDEKLHRRRIPRGFAIGAREVTVSEFQAFQRENLGVRHSLNRATSPEPDCPVGSVTWFQAAQYCRWLSEREGLPEEEMCYPPIDQIGPGMKLPPDHLERAGYRLPTEAEWEYAARAGTRGPGYHGSSTALSAKYAWFQLNSESRTWPVASLFPNALGLFDVLGNTREWCSEAYGDYPESRGSEAVMSSSETGALDPEKKRILRGGSFEQAFPSATSRLTSRDSQAPGVSSQNVGFRVARTLPGKDLLVVRAALKEARKSAEVGNLAAERVARADAGSAYVKLLETHPDREDLALAYASFLFEELDGWTVVEPSEIAAAGGTALVRQPDGSILASGPNTAAETYTLRFPAPISPVTGLRLEVIPDPSLPGKGTGRSPVGSFTLSRIETSIQSDDSGASVPVEWQHAFASFEQTDDGLEGLAEFTAAKTLSSEGGWAVSPRQIHPQELVLETLEPIEASRGAVWTVELVQEGAGHHLGRFRLSLSTDPGTVENAPIRMHLRQNPIHPWIQLAVAQALRGKDGEARSALRRDRRRETEVSRAEQLARSWVYQRLGELDDARRMLTLAVGWIAEGDALPEVTIPLVVDLIDRLLESSSRHAPWLHDMHFFTRQVGIPKAAELPAPGADALAILLHLLEARLPFRGVQTAERVLADDELRNAETLHALARLQRRTDRIGDAIRTLEEGLRRAGPEEVPNLSSQLLRYREEARPRLLTYASLDDLGVSDSIVPDGATWKYFRGVREPSPGLEWTTLDYDDVRWEEGVSGLGYGDNDDRTVLTDMQNGYTTLYLRHAFEIEHVDEWREVSLRVWVDDGYVAYLNGEEVGRYQAGEGRVSSDGVATATVDNGEFAPAIDLTGKLVAGKNILAVQGLNADITSSDLSLSPTISGQLTDEGIRRRRETTLAGLDEESLGPLREYFGALRSQTRGEHEDAIARLEAMVRADPAPLEPWLRLVESLVAGGRASEAASRLRAHFSTSRVVSGVLLDAWFKLSREELGRDWIEIYRLVPRSTIYTGEGDARDVLWALKSLQETGALRINCGGAGLTGQDGRFWARDRFSIGATRFEGPRLRGVGDTRKYERGSRFSNGETGEKGYRIPLPRGTYEVRLGFCDRRRELPRRLDVKIEGEIVLPGLELPGAKPVEHPVPCRIEDGTLDLDLSGYRADPVLSTIEIVRIPPAALLTLTDAWIERTERRLPTALVWKARLLIGSENSREALALLEEAARHPEFRPEWETLLAATRADLAPDLPSFTSIDAAIDSGAPDEPIRGFRTLAEGNPEAFTARLAYMEGRLLERDARYAEAFANFQLAAAAAPGQVEPLLRALASLEHLPDEERASLLRKWKHALGEETTISESSRQFLTDLAETIRRRGIQMGALFEALPDLAALDPSDPLTDELWALREMEAHSVLRINCGAAADVERDGVTWSRDRLYAPGTAVYNADSTNIFASERQFPRFADEEPAYRIPLPSGAYRVTLHLMEGFAGRQESGGRRFDVQLEGRTVLRDHDPLLAVGFRRRDTRTFSTWVRGGGLEIHVIQRATPAPNLRALEIERLEPADWPDLPAAEGLSRDEANLDALGALVSGAARRGHLSRAIDWLVRSEKLEGFSPELRELRLDYELRLSEMIRKTPETPEELVYRGRYYLFQKRLPEAAADFERALMLSPVGVSSGLYSQERIQLEIFSQPELLRHVIELRVEDLSFLRAVFEQCIDGGLWKQAADLLPRLESIDSVPTIDYYKRAVLTLFSGDREGYLEICRGMPEDLARHPQRDRYDTPERLVRSCLLIPHSPEVNARHLELIDRLNLAGSTETGRQWYCQALGLALYRAGRLEDALGELERSLSNPADPRKDCAGHVMIAMTRFQLGRREEALVSLKRGEELFRRIDEPGWGVTLEMWQDWMVFRILRGEAMELLGEALQPSTAQQELPKSAEDR